jgi:hypothetical protein
LYQKRFAEYVNYRKTEQRLIELTEKYEEMAKREQDRRVTPRIAGKGFTRSRTVLRNGPAGEGIRTLVKAVMSAVKTFLRSFSPFFLFWGTSSLLRELW